MMLKLMPQLLSAVKPLTCTRQVDVSWLVDITRSAASSIGRFHTISCL